MNFEDKNKNQLADSFFNINIDLIICIDTIKMEIDNLNIKHFI